MKAYDSKVLKTDQGDNVLVVKLPEEVLNPDYYEGYMEKNDVCNLVRAREEIENISEKSYQYVAFDCSEFTYGCLKFMGCLCVLLSKLRRKNSDAKIIFINMSKNMITLMKIIKLFDSFDFVDSEEELIENGLSEKKIMKSIEFVPITSTAFMLKKQLPGLGWLVLKDLFVTNLIVDDYDIGNPKENEHLLLWQNFRGFFNVPSGEYDLTGQFIFNEPDVIDLSATCKVFVQPDEATIKVYSSKPARWDDDTPLGEAQYKKLAENGGMPGCLRGWPHAMLFFHQVNKEVTFNDRSIDVFGTFWAIAEIKPGNHVVMLGDEMLKIDCPEESVQVIDGKSNKLLEVDDAVQLIDQYYPKLQNNVYFRL